MLRERLQRVILSFRRALSGAIPRFSGASRRGPRLRRLAWAAVLCGSALLAFAIWIVSGLWPVNPGSGRDRILTVPVGSGLGQITRNLKKAGLIRNHLAFNVFVRLAGSERTLRAGEYHLSTAMSGPAILKKLGRGEQAVFTITFPEGMTAREVAQTLAQRGLVDVEGFMDVLSGDRLASEYADLTRARPPEGFLFPDTYRVAEGTAPEAIARMMIARFREVFAPELAEEARRRGMSIHEVVTLASIIEEEAKFPEERPLISAVFQNRLKQGRPLQSCATVQYALGHHKARLSYDDLEIDSPYNTYRHTGLTPGPIASPGLDSIRAVLFPAKVNYLYFVARSDGTHVFSTTYRDHLRAQRGIRN